MCKKSNKLRKNKCHNRKHRKKYAKRARFKNRKQRRSITGRKPYLPHHHHPLFVKQNKHHLPPGHEPLLTQPS